MSCVSKEIGAVSIAWFESSARKRRNNVCDVAIMRSYVHIYIHM